MEMADKLCFKFLYLCLLILLSPVFVLCSPEWYVSITGGMNSVLMGEYNSAIKSANKYNQSIGIKSSLNQILFGAQPSLEVGYNFTAPAGLAAVYLKNELSVIKDTSSIALWPSGRTAQKISGDFSAVYTGVGLKKYAFDDSVFNPYLGIDAGLTYYFNNSMDEETALEDGTYSYRVKKSWNTAFAGAGIEAGANWMFSESAGLNLKAGYRYSRGSVMVKTENVYGWTGESQGESQADYSGFYFGTGLVLAFGSTEKKAVSMAIAAGAEQFPEIGKKIYADAVTLYNAGLYKQAEVKFTELNQISPGNAETKKYLDDINLKLEGDKKAENIKKLLTEADEYRAKNKFKEAYIRYAEINRIDTGNETALFYLKYFRETALARYGDAKALNAQGKINAALKLAKEASEYSPDDRQIADYVKELKGNKSSRKKADALYNEGVLNFQKGYYDKAIIAWQKVVEIYPDDAEALKNIELAKDKYKNSNAAEEQSAEQALKEARDFFEQGLMEESLAKADYVLRIDSNNAEALKLAEEIKAKQENKTTTLNKR